jgi:hypothetical protein
MRLREANFIIIFHSLFATSPIFRELTKGFTRVNFIIMVDIGNEQEFIAIIKVKINHFIFPKARPAIIR